MNNSNIGSKFITVDGVKAHYLESGNGDEVVLLLHAWPTGALMWDKHMPMFPQKYHVIAPDFPGFGYSEMLQKPHISQNYAEFIYSFLQELGYSNVHVVGYSYGAIVAFRLVLIHPEIARSVTLGGMPYYYKYALPKGSKKFFELMDEYTKVQQLLHTFTRSRMSKYLSRLRGKQLRNVTPAQLTRYYKYFTNYKDHALRDTAEELTSLDLRRLLPKMQKHCLLLVGSGDSRVRLDDAYKLNKLIPNSELKIIEGATHLLPVEKPQELVDNILKNIKHAPKN